MASSVCNKNVYEIMQNHDLKFLDKCELPRRLTCVICKKVLKNARQTLCGCKGCEQCFSKLLKDGLTKCPTKQQDCEEFEVTQDSISIDNATNKEILALKVECPNKKCLVTMMVKELPSHFNECQYRSVKCGECGVEYQLSSKKIHETEKCSKRKVNCEYCKEKMTHYEYMNSHKNSNSENFCSKLMDYCPNRCGVKEKVIIKEHLRVCMMKKVKCPYGEIGCEMTNMSKKELKIHLSEERLNHIKSLVDMIMDLKEKISSHNDRKESVKFFLTKSIKQKKERSTVYFDLLDQNRKLKDKTISPPSSLSLLPVNKVVVFRNGAFICKITQFNSMVYLNNNMTICCHGHSNRELR